MHRDTHTTCTRIHTRTPHTHMHTPGLEQHKRTPTHTHTHLTLNHSNTRSGKMHGKGGFHAGQHSYVGAFFKVGIFGPACGCSSC